LSVVTHIKSGDGDGTRKQNGKCNERKRPEGAIHAPAEPAPGSKNSDTSYKREDRSDGAKRICAPEAVHRLPEWRQRKTTNSHQHRNNSGVKYRWNTAVTIFGWHYLLLLRQSAFLSTDEP
jgi:hypothetical protein